MFTIILYKRPTISVPFFQPNSAVWQSPELNAYYQSIQDSGTLVSDTIEFSIDQLIMKKTMVWHSSEKWQNYATEFAVAFPNYAFDRQTFHNENQSQFLVKTFLNENYSISSSGGLQANITIENVNGVISSSYVLT